jgi:hypothetical protein
LYAIGIIGILCVDFVNVFFVHNYILIMSLAENDNFGVRMFNYVIGVICLLGHLVFGILMLTNANKHVDTLKE